MVQRQLHSCIFGVQVRPGRVDVRLAFAHATAEQTRNFFISFYQASKQP